MACWEGLEDPRSGNAGLHDFHELLVIAMCTVLCGGQGAVNMALFAKAKEPFLRSFLELNNGVPSHDTEKSELPVSHVSLLMAAWVRAEEIAPVWSLAYIGIYLLINPQVVPSPLK
jgi:hypothetical protein